MKVLKILIVIIGFGINANSQQMGLFSQYMFNDYLINPAIVGSKNYIPIHLSVRRQWLGITEAPVAQQISTHAYTGHNFGIGGAIFNEATGPTRRTGFNFSTAYHLVLKQQSRRDQLTLSMGLQGSLTQHILDKTQLTTYVPDDPTIMQSYNYQLIPDVGFGFLLHKSNQFYVGISALNLIQTKKDLYNLNNKITNKIVRNYFLTGGYTFNFEAAKHKKFVFQPSLLFRMIEATPMQFDINAKLTYENKMWVGLSYRHKDAIVTIIGVRIYQLLVGYAYDITTSDIRNYSMGTHEIALTFILNEGYNNKRRKGNIKKYKPTSPSI